MLNVTDDEWREFLGYIERYHGSIEDFFTEQVLKFIVTSRDKNGRKLN